MWRILPILMLLVGGCAQSLEPAPPRGVMSVISTPVNGYWVPEGIEQVLRIEDPEERLKQFAELMRPIPAGTAMMRGETALWLLEQVERAGRAKVEME